MPPKKADDNGSNEPIHRDDDEIASNAKQDPKTPSGSSWKIPVSTSRGGSSALGPPRGNVPVPPPRAPRTTPPPKTNPRGSSSKVRISPSNTAAFQSDSPPITPASKSTPPAPRALGISSNPGRKSRPNLVVPKVSAVDSAEASSSVPKPLKFGAQDRRKVPVADGPSENDDHEKGGRKEVGEKGREIRYLRPEPPSLKDLTPSFDQAESGPQIDEDGKAKGKGGSLTIFGRRGKAPSPISTFTAKPSSSSPYKALSKPKPNAEAISPTVTPNPLFEPPGPARSQRAATSLQPHARAPVFGTNFFDEPPVALRKHRDRSEDHLSQEKIFVLAEQARERELAGDREIRTAPGESLAGLQPAWMVRSFSALSLFRHCSGL